MWAYLFYNYPAVCLRVGLKKMVQFHIFTWEGDRRKRFYKARISQRWLQRGRQMPTSCGESAG